MRACKKTDKRQSESSDFHSRVGQQQSSNGIGDVRVCVPVPLPPTVRVHCPESVLSGLLVLLVLLVVAVLPSWSCCTGTAPPAAANGSIRQLAAHQRSENTFSATLAHALTTVAYSTENVPNGVCSCCCSRKLLTLYSHQFLPEVCSH